MEVDAEAGTTRFHAYLLPGSEMDVSTMYWLSASEVYSSLDRLSAAHPAMKVRSIGTTPAGRDIPVVELFDDDSGAGAQPFLCIAATPQSHELGTIATMYLIEESLGGCLRHVAEGIRLVFIPLPNPDGNAGGTCMTNSLDENLHFGYSEDGPMPVECKSIWDYLGTVSPAAYLEFHSYPHLSRPSYRPYEWDVSLFPDETSREAGRRFFSALGQISPNTPYRIEAETDQERRFRTSLPSLLIRKRGVPATIYKLHNRETVTLNRTHAAYVVDRLSAAIATGIGSPA